MMPPADPPPNWEPLGWVVTVLLLGYYIHVILSTIWRRS